MKGRAQDDDLLMHLVDLALAKPREERDSFLREACSGDPELYQKAWSYVEWDDKMQGFLEQPLFQPLTEHPFEEGALIEGRFRLDREIAQGGMGVVYEAWDEKLDRRIAIKCAKFGFSRRLPPEVRLAREISHPNVCRIFEIHTTHTASGEVDFVTMEYLEGETLAERIKRRPLSPAEALLITRQLCAGLGAAHRQGVIHGDLKSGNVILTKSADGTTRAAITDFGMARMRESSEGTTQTGPRGGTPDYMAPELLKGERATLASDVYALGILLRELTTGDRKAAMPSGRWSPVINRCLAEVPEDRYSSAVEVARAFEPTQTRRWFLITAAALLVAVLTGVVTYQRATAPKEVVRLAMLPFESSADLQPAAEEIFGETSANLGTLKGGTRARYSSVSLADAQRSGVTTMEQAKAKLGATHVLHGSLSKEKDQVVLRAWLTDTRNGVDLKYWKMDYLPGQVKYVPVALAGVVTGTLHLPALSVRAMNAAAQSDYDAGSALLRHDATVDDAIAAFERAVTEDPDSALTYAGLAEAQWLKNFVSRRKIWYDRAVESLKEAQRRNMDLPRVLFVSGTLNVLNSWYEQATAEYSRAIELQPNYSDAYRFLARVYELNGQLDQAQVAYRRAAETDPEYYRPQLALGEFYIERDHYREAIPFLRRAVDLAPQEPYVRYWLALAYMNTGGFNEAERELRQGLARLETPDVLDGLGTVLMYQRRERDAIPFFTRTLVLDPTQYVAWRNLEICYRRLNMSQEALHAARTGLEVAEVGKQTNPKLAYPRSFVGYFQARLGRRQLAESEIAQARTFSNNDPGVLWMAVLTYEALRERQSTLDALAMAGPQLLGDLSRWPDLAELQKDPHFIQLLASNVVP